jgi:hypothetical protein
MKGLRISWPYGFWLIAAASSGIGSRAVFSDDGPALAIPAMLAAFLGFGIWLALINKANKCSEGWVADVLFGIFVAAALFKWGLLAAMALEVSSG